MFVVFDPVGLLKINNQTDSVISRDIAMDIFSRDTLYIIYIHITNVNGCQNHPRPA